LPWLRRAAAEPDNFYGLLARRRLRDLLDRDATRGTLGEADAAAVDATPEGHRAFAFLQVGQPEAAETELRRLWPRTGGDPALRRAILLVARTAGLPDLVTALADDWAQAGAVRPQPPPNLPNVRPRGGFVVSPALIYAVARVESGFDAAAVSPYGARGMMQVMPATAAYVAGAAAASHMSDAAENLAIGQKYLLYLARTDEVDHDLLRLLACYNDGPGNAAKWMGAIDRQGDPLLFIEQIPLDETRRYVRRALAFAWTYAAHLHVAAPGLDALAAGEWPRLGARTEVTAQLN
jgi:soluble lytic murein transglycosylase-like protein